MKPDYKVSAQLNVKSMFGPFIIDLSLDETQNPKTTVY